MLGVQIGHKGAGGSIRPLMKPRNHAVFLRQYVSVPSLCHRFGHDLADFTIPGPLWRLPTRLRGSRSRPTARAPPRQPRIRAVSRARMVMTRIDVLSLLVLRCQPRSPRA